jgi:hypothetical protein
MPPLLTRARRVLAVVAFLFFTLPIATPAAESTTGAIVGNVLTATGKPVAGAHVLALSPSGRYAATTDSSGRFSLLNITPDTYSISSDAPGFSSATRDGVTVLAGQTQSVAFTMQVALKTIASVRSSAKAFAVGSTADTFTVTGDTAKATYPVAGAAGVAQYTQGTVQGAIAAVPGVEQDAFANAILRGTKIQDAVFDYDSVPIPQGLVAEPGGAIDSAQLFTTGVGSTTTTLAGFEAEGQNALGGVIDQIPAVGTYPGSATLDVWDGIGALNQGYEFDYLGATPDRRWRYAFSAGGQNQYLSYGDGTTFYPAEGGYGLALQSRGDSTASGNIHFQLTPKDDLSITGLWGNAAYDYYMTPFSGETNGFLNGKVTQFPCGGCDQNALVDTPGRVLGNYNVLKAQWVHTGSHTTARFQTYLSQFGSNSGGAWWDDDSFPDGSISLQGAQGGKLFGASYDVDDYANSRNHIKYGVQYTTNNSYLYQLVPTADEFIHSNPTIFTELLYLGDTYSVGSRLDVTGTLRTEFNHIVPSGGYIYDANFIDPHLGFAYRIGSQYGFRATYDRTSVAPLPLEADRYDTTNPAPFVALAPETGNSYTYSFEGGGKTQFRATYYAYNEANVIDILPVNFREAVGAGQNPLGVGVPTNAGEFRAHGFELWVKRAGFTLDTNFVKAYSGSAAQFALNDLNAAAQAAGHLFPVGYIPDFTANVSYEADFIHRHLRIVPQLSYESGYPYGNGTDIWIFNAKGQPIQVPNDNYLNPGYNYYFLKNPNCPLNRVPGRVGGKPGCVPGVNPYIANLGGGEGADPNSLRSTPQLITNLHIEGDLSPQLTASVDIVNLFGVATPQQLIGNQYLIGPPGYTGGNPIWSQYYAEQVCGGKCPKGTSYPYGNGIPTNYFYNTPAGQNAIRQSIPWTYGTQGYMPLGYPMARTVEFRLRYRLK